MSTGADPLAPPGVGVSILVDALPDSLTTVGSAVVAAGEAATFADSGTSDSSPLSRADCTCSGVSPTLAAKAGSVVTYCLYRMQPLECWYANPAHPEHPA
eukprot:6223145-Amphidinium_carterae.1